MPTKTEQADLLMAMYGRHGECPLVVLAAATPADCFSMAFEAVRLAITYMTPVMLLSDSFLASSAEPWRVVGSRRAARPALRGAARRGRQFAPYRRDPATLARPWVTPGAPGREHRIGGLEKTDVTGMVSYDGANHQRMVELRAQKIEGIARDIPPAEVTGAAEGDLLVVGWGSTYGAIAAAVDELLQAGRSVAHLHLRYLNPFPANLGSILVAVPARPGSGEQQRAPALDAPRPLSWWMPSGFPRWKAGRSVSRRSGDSIESLLGGNDDMKASRIAGCCTDDAQAEDPSAADEEGLPIRPGSQMVPRLRRVRHPLGGAERAAAPGRPAGEDRVRLRHRLLVAVYLLPEHLRDPRHPRPRARHRHGGEMRAARTCRSGSSPGTATASPSAPTT